jgi:transcriptional regulator with XRE-family HTH domain
MAIWNERIRKKRLEKGYTLLQIAEKLNVSEATAQRYESGNIKNVPYEHMCTYAEMLNCTPSYLTGWTDDEKHDRVQILIAENLDITEDEKDLVKLYRILNTTGKSKASEYMTDLSENQKYTS